MLDVLQQHVPLGHNVLLLRVQVQNQILKMTSQGWGSSSDFCTRFADSCARFSYLLLLEDGLLLQDLHGVELVVGPVARQQHLAEAALADDLEEVEVAGLGRGV